MVKKNQPLLHARIKALPWRQVPAGSITRHTGHGRTETRTLKAARQIGSPARWGSPSKTTITVAYGATAHAQLLVEDPADFGSRCAIGFPARPGRGETFASAAGFRVYPPDQIASKVMPFPFAACGHTGPVWISAGAVTAGGAPAE